VTARAIAFRQRALKLFGAPQPPAETEWFAVTKAIRDDTAKFGSPLESTCAAMAELLCRQHAARVFRRDNP